MKVAIAGYGTEGRSNFAYYAALGHDVTIVDEREVVNAPQNVPVLSGEGAFERLNGFDLVVRTAGLAPRKITTDGQVWSATNEFFVQCPAPIIGVTGSKGKGTTCSLIASILRAAGFTVHLVGNIGVPALDVLPQIKSGDIVVYELSSFQLWDLQKSPQVAVVLMIEPDHLDVHVDFNEYVTAKSNITAHQSTDDLAVYYAHNDVSTDIGVRSQGLQQHYPTAQTAHVKDNAFYYGNRRLCSIDALKLPGAHNLDNACAAITATWRWVQDGTVIARGIAAFDGLPHRLKFVRSVDGVAYYDDSIATTPGSAIAALRAFTQPKIVIMGGSGKGADFAELATVVFASNVKKVLLIGEEAPRIADVLHDVEWINLGADTTMANIVNTAQSEARAGDVVLLSPACASFGMFNNYADRGDQFVAAVNALR